MRKGEDDLGMTSAIVLQPRVHDMRHTFQSTAIWGALACLQTLIPTNHGYPCPPDAVQDALAQIDRLRDLLEESAAWGSADKGASAESAVAPPSGPGGIPPAAAAAAGEGSPQVQVQQQRQLLLEERARCAGLELGMRALAAELTRAQHARWEKEGGGCVQHAGCAGLELGILALAFGRWEEGEGGYGGG